MDRRVDRPGGRPRRLARAGLRGQDVHALGAERDGVRDRRVVDDPAVDQPPVADGHRRKDARDRGRGDDGVDCDPRREQNLVTGDHVVGDDVQGRGGVAEVLVLDVPA